MAAPGRLGLTKEEIRRIALAKLSVVYRDWNIGQPPFGGRDIGPGSRRRHRQAFETALVAGLLGGLSEAIAKNNEALIAALGAKDRHARKTARMTRRARRGRREGRTS